jgi:TRAP-type C4-dicarboxylate transport system permease large subunit
MILAEMGFATFVVVSVTVADSTANLITSASVPSDLTVWSTQVVKPRATVISTIAVIMIFDFICSS